MATEVILPRVDMDMTTGSISRWFVAEGEQVEKGAILFEIETDKAAMEIDAPASGRVHRLAADDGTAIPVGSRVAWILGEGENAPEGDAVASAQAPASSDSTVAQEAPSEAKADLPSSPSPSSPTPEPSPASALAADGKTSDSGPVAACDKTRARATPLARRLARERQIDLTALSGSGPNGRIQSRDVEAAAHQETAPAQPAAFDASPASAAEPVRAESPARSPATPTPPSPRTNATAEGTLHRVWLRRGTGTPLLLIHGFGSETGMWRPLVAALPGERPVLAVDLPGHGQSPAGATIFEAIVESVGRVLAEEAVSEAHLVGHSLGAAVAVALADGGFVGARSLFLMSPAGLGPDIDSGFLAGFTRARDAASLAPWMRLLVHDPKSLPASLVAATARARSERDLDSAQASLAEALFPDATQVFSIRAALSRVSVPTRILSGLADRIIPARHAFGLPGTIGLHLFPEVGHMPQLEIRDAVVRLLGEHVR